MLHSQHGCNQMCYKFLIQGALPDALRDVLQFVLLKDFYFSCHLYAAILFTSRKQSVKIFCKLLIVVKYFFENLTPTQKIFYTIQARDPRDIFYICLNLWLWSEVKETSLLTAACKYHVVEACDQKQEKKHPSYYNNLDCILFFKLISF